MGLRGVSGAQHGRRGAFIGKAVEGAILGGYSFDRYKREKTVDKIQLSIAGLKAHDAQEPALPLAIHDRLRSVNEARDMINEPGSVATPEYLAQAARNIAKERISI